MTQFRDSQHLQTHTLRHAAPLQTPMEDPRVWQEDRLQIGMTNTLIAMLCRDL